MHTNPRLYLLSPPTLLEPWGCPHLHILYINVALFTSSPHCTECHFMRSVSGVGSVSLLQWAVGLTL
ncbi:hypothetical protein E2C01_058502 [Portunus trituberculatus]|uniref:Uncharacterized protein n=1 Tax=Portunus trituberculatus TaxID=210409 RepID=A0A5B7H4V1_PORTR|nr:hypothetical protein [Portunus trituberculatus]